MSEKVRTKDLLNEVKEIQDVTKSLRVIVEKLPGCSLQKAYLNSVINLESKNEKFLLISEPLTGDQKEAIALIKSGKVPASKVLEGFSEVPADMEKSVSIPKKGKK